MFEAWWVWRVTWKGPEMTRANDKGGDTSRGSDAGTLNVSAPDFSATLAVAGPSLRVVLRGMADVNVLGELERFLGELHARAGAHGSERVALGPQRHSRTATTRRCSQRTFHVRRTSWRQPTA
jgi:hypothetical protein